MFEKVRGAFMKAWNETPEQPAAYLDARLLPAPKQRMTHEDRLEQSRFNLCQKWATSIYHAANEQGITFDLPVQAITTGRLAGLLVNARADTERLISFLKSRNTWHLIPFDFTGEPSVSMAGKRVMLTIGLPTNLIESTILLPEYWPFDLSGQDGEFVLGRDVYGRQVQGRFDDSLPHMLISGATGSGKSEAVKLITYQLAQSGGDLILCDLKFGATLKHYDRLNGVLFELATTDEQVKDALSWALAEMERRYLDDQEHNKLYIVIDEMADMPKAGLELLNRILRKGRGAGIHVIGTIQNPSMANLQSLDLKRNFVGRLVLRVDSRPASEVALGTTDFDASKLLGKGDAVFYDGQALTRLQCYYLRPEVAKLAQLYRPVNERSQDAVPALPEPKTTEDDYRAVAHKLIEGNPHAGRDRLKQAIKEAGLPSVSTDRLAALMRDAKR